MFQTSEVVGEWRFGRTDGMALDSLVHVTRAYAEHDKTAPPANP